MAVPTLIGIDVGTTAVKAILIDTNGNRLADFTQPYPMARPQPGYAEQNPDDWMRGILSALEAFSLDHDLNDLKGIGICSQVNTHVFVDSSGVPLFPAITWQDGRCAKDAARLDGQISAEQKTAWFGGPMPIDASHALSRMAYMNRAHPEIFGKTRHVLLPKDYCVMKLTGAVASDPVAAVGLVDASLNYIDDLIALVPGGREKLPPLSGFSHCVGTVSNDHPCAGVPVVVGAMDAWGGMFGVGVVANGDAMYQSGTSEILGLISPSINPTPGVIVFPPYDGIILHAAPTQSGGAALAWWSNILGKTPAEASAMAADVLPSAFVPLFLPHLQGERAPLWDTQARGIFARIDASAGPGEMTRAVMEGVAFSAKLAFDALEASAGFSPEVINLGGGGSRSDVWCQIRADVLGKQLQRTKVSDVGALGAAMLAGIGSGEMQSLKDAARNLVQFDKTFVPDPAMGGYYAEKFERYQDIYATLKPFQAQYQSPE